MRREHCLRRQLQRPLVPEVREPMAERHARLSVAIQATVPSMRGAGIPETACAHVSAFASREEAQGER
jgi:hypothetical protein